MSKNRRAFVVLTAIGVLGLTACVVLFADLQARSNDDPPSTDTTSKKQSTTAQVTVIVPSAGGGSRTTTQPASVHAFGIVDLYAKVSGYLTNQTVDIGDPVKKGQVLAEIDAPEIKAAKARAAAELEKAHAAVVQMQSTVAARQADRVAAEAKQAQSAADLQSYQAKLTFAKLQHDRIKSLAEMKSIEWELVDEKSKLLEVAESDLRAGQKALETAKAQVASADAAIQEAQATLSDAKAQVRVAQANLDTASQFVEYTRIRAPFDGVITLRTYYDGDFIRAATGGGNVPTIAEPLLRVARTDKMRVVVELPDRYVPFANQGDSVTLRIDALPQENLSGVISRLASAEKYDTRYMRVEIDQENPDGTLHDGMYGSATIVLEKERPGVQIPSNCLIGPENEGERSVFIIHDSKAKRCQVKVGDDNGKRAQIVSGLTQHDQVITGRLGSLKEQMPVKVVATKRPNEWIAAGQSSSQDDNNAPQRSTDSRGGQMR